MIKLTLKNGCYIEWEKGEYDDYYFDGKVIAIKKDNKLVGFYNLNNVIAFTVCDNHVTKDDNCNFFRERFNRVD